jgi:hypothetical protein
MTFKKAIMSGSMLIPMIILANTVFGQESIIDNYNVEFIATPLVMSDPNFGNGVGAMTMVLFDMDPENDDLQASSVGGTGVYSDRGSYFIGLGGIFYPNDDFIFKTVVGNGDIKSELDVDHFDETVETSTGVNAIALDGQYRFAESIFGGLRTVASWISYSPENDAGEGYLELMEAEDTASIRFGPAMTYDTRDNRFFPYAGVLSEISFMYHGEALGNEVDYYVLEGTVNGYRQFRPGHIFAARFSGRFTPEQTPYPGLSTLGKKSDLRGYVAGEHVANNLCSLQGEYRWNFHEKWWLIGFVGEAALFDGGDINSDSFYTSGGGGLRYTLSEERRVKVRIDVAWGEGNSDGVYFGVSEAF